MLEGFTNDAETAIRAGCAQAADEGKRVAVVFGAEWCPDCEAFRLALQHRLIAPILGPNFVVVKISIGDRDRNLDVMARYGMSVRGGIPSVAVLEPDGSLVASQHEGEFRNAATLLSVAEIASFFNRVAPSRPATA